MLKDMHSRIETLRVLSPVSVADNTAQVGQIIDHRGAVSIEYIIATGSLADADATFTVLLEEGDVANMSDAGTPVAADLIGTAALASFIFSDDDTTKKIGYIGSKRYSRLTITPAANASAALISAVCVRGLMLRGSIT